MKKYAVFFLIIIITFVLVNNTPTTRGFTCIEDISLNRVNSRNFIKYLEEKEISKIQKICSYEYCEEIKNADYEVALSNYSENYLNLVKEKYGNDAYLEIYYKGFKITKIEISNC